MNVSAFASAMFRNNKKGALLKAVLIVTFACMATLWVISEDQDYLDSFPSPSDSAFNHRILSHENDHEDDKLCIATVNDGTISTASVVDEKGHFELALPKDYEAEATIKCIQYSRVDPTRSTEQSTTGDRYTETSVVKQGGGNDPSVDCSDYSLSFQPGYLDHRTDSWVDHCTGLALTKSPTSLSKEGCPVTATNKKLWVLFIGDSVSRGFLDKGLKDVLEVKKEDFNHWVSERAKAVHSPYPDFSQAPLMRDGENEIWLSYSFQFLNKPSGKMAWALPNTWGDFVQERGEGQRDDDPDYDDDKVPDIIFFSPGYHASELTSNEYALDTERVLTKWQDKIREKKQPDAPMPQIHLLLNMMPAPWLIPDKFSGDRLYRTLLNEYRKNLALLAVVKKHSDRTNVGDDEGEGFVVKSVVDTFSIELAFNGQEGNTPHGDAVHINSPHGGSHVFKAIMDRIMDTICYMEEDRAELSLESQ